MPSFIVEDKDAYLEWLEEEYAKIEKFGSTIFPMKGNEKFESIKADIKADMKKMKKVIKAIKAGESKVEI